MKSKPLVPAVTSLPQSPKDEADHRVRRYALTMTIRIVCFALGDEVAARATVETLAVVTISRALMRCDDPDRGVVVVPVPPVDGAQAGRA